MNYRGLLFSLTLIAGGFNHSALAGGVIKYRSLEEKYEAESAQKALVDRIRKEESQGLTRVYVNENANSACMDTLSSKDLPDGLEVAFGTLFSETLPTVSRSYGPALSASLEIERDQILTSLITGYDVERSVFKVFITVSSPEQKKSVVSFLESKNRMRDLRALVEKKHPYTSLRVYFVEAKAKTE